MKNVFYSSWICKIGGLESFFYYLAKTHPWPDWDLTIYYGEGDPEQLKRYNKYCNIKKWNGQDIVCDTFWCNFNIAILDHVKAKHINLVLHGDYYTEVMNGNMLKKDIPFDPRVEQYYGITQVVCDGWEKLTGKKTKLIYNPVAYDEQEKPLQLISATRLTKEKGYKRMIKLANLLDEANIKYDWHVFTTGQIKDDRFIIHRPTLNIIPYIKEADALVQLSDSEGYCYSVVESLMEKTPVIVTKIPVFLKELGLNESNSILVDFDMENIPIERIRNIREMDFEYTPPISKWDDFLVKGESEEEKTKMKILQVKATKECLEFMGSGISIPEAGGIPRKGQIFEVTEERAEKLLHSSRGVPLIEIVGVLEDTPKAKKEETKELTLENKSSAKRPKKALNKGA